MPTDPQPTDDPLIARAQDGDVAAFGALVDAHQSLVRGWLRVRLADWAGADDLAQEVFITAFRRIRTFTGEGAFAGWLLGIARNHLRNHLRKHQEEAVGGAEELAGLIDQGMAECFAGRDEGRLVEALRACLEPLGEHARGLLEQRYVDGRTVRDLAAASGRGYSALTMQLHRLREVLAECITTRVVAEGGARP
jgi:RNA polymerase sigma-70 factor (ECF subfamily)